MEQYSNLNVHGNITQKAAQGTADDDVLVIKGIAPRSDKPTTSTGTSATCFKGQTAVINGATYLCTNVTNNVDASHPLGENTVWTYTWISVGDPNGVSNPNTSTANHIAVFSDGTGKVIGDSGITIGTAAGATASTHAINSTNAGSSGSYKDELSTNGQVYTALTDGTVTKVGTATKGGTLKIMYLDAGAPTDGTQLYAKKMTVNGTAYSNIIRSTNADLASIYAPTTAGSSTNVLRSGGSGAPTWDSVDTSVTQNSTHLVTSGAVWTAIDNMPEPMIFKGSLGTGGTITSLPTAASSNEGWVYKVIVAGTYASQAAKVGDTFICANTGSNTYKWELIPSGDEPSGTVTSVATDNTYLQTDQPNSGPITSSGTISHKTSGVTAGSYGPSANATPAYGATFDVPYITVDAAGHLTAASTKTVKIPASDNTDAKVQQKGITADDEYPILLKYNTGTSDVAANYVNFGKATDAIPTINPSTGNVTAPKVNGLTLTAASTGFTIAGGTTSKTLTVGADYTLAAACAKAVDTSIAAASTSANLPTSQAVASFVEGKGYITSHQTIKQDGITGATVTRYASCTTGAFTAEKKANVTNGTFALEAGARVTVNFSYRNTASSPTLNINSTGAKDIYFDGTRIVTGTWRNMLYGVCDFVYDGTQWHLVGNSPYQVKQEDTTNSDDLPLLLSASAINTVTTTTSTVKRCDIVYANPSVGRITASGGFSSDTAWTTEGVKIDPKATGYEIYGGTTSKKLIVNENYTLAAACAKAVTDSSSASAIGTGTSLPTERDIYYGLPTINNSHAYTSSTAIYAPSGAGTANQILKSSGGTNAPVWADITSLMPIAATDVTLADM